MSPEAIATMVGVLTLWSGAHFFGIGEIADVVLLVVGWAAIGGMAIEAARELYDFGSCALGADSEEDLDKAAKHLATAVSLLGVQVALALLTKQQPKNKVFQHHYSKSSKIPYKDMPELPRSDGPFYKPKLIFTKDLEAGQARTNVVGDIRIGRQACGGDAARASEEIQVSLYHEQVHRFLTPKLQIFREFRVYAKQSGYAKSYILRYLEEALAETVARARMYGLQKEHVVKGIKFPFIKNKYEISIYEMESKDLWREAKGLAIGTISTGGSVFIVLQHVRSQNYDHAHKQTH